MVKWEEYIHDPWLWEYSQKLGRETWEYSHGYIIYSCSKESRTWVLGVGLGNMFLVTRGPEYAKYSFNQGSFEDLGSSSSSHANSINFLS
jgi:hypothetical protein